MGDYRTEIEDVLVMGNQRQYTVRDFRLAVDAVGASVARVADHLGCSRSTVYSYRRRFDEVEGLFSTGTASTENKARGVQYTDEMFLDAIRRSNGVLKNVADSVGCSYELARVRIRESDVLREAFGVARESLVDVGESAIVSLVKSDDEKVKLGAAKFILSTQGKDRGWSSRTEITGADGEALFSPEIVEMMRALGMSPSGVVAQFEAMVRSEYAKTLTP